MKGLNGIIRKNMLNSHFVSYKGVAGIVVLLVPAQAERRIRTPALNNVISFIIVYFKIHCTDAIAVSVTYQFYGVITNKMLRHTDIKKTSVEKEVGTKTNCL